jgi:protein TonB
MSLNLDLEEDARMFETITQRTTSAKRAPWKTVVLSASAHLSVVMALLVSTLYVADALPQPPDMMAFVVAPPPPPPPPIPPPPPAAPEPAKPQPGPVPEAPAIVEPPPVAAPIEAPSTIAPETGREADVWKKVEPGFEKGVEGGAAGGVGALDLAPPSPPPAPVRIGGSISAPKLLRRVEPDYPAAAQTAQIQGIVILEATVDEQGAVDAVKVLRSNSLLDAAATTAVKQWKYAPLLLNGRATPFVLTVTVSFDLTR